jgi:hypothetical protein
VHRLYSCCYTEFNVAFMIEFRLSGIGRDRDNHVFHEPLRSIDQTCDANSRQFAESETDVPPLVIADCLFPLRHLFWIFWCYEALYPAELRAR